MNKLYFGDCLDILKKLNKEHPSGFIDLIYIDPPFNSKRNYNILFENVDLKDTKAQKEAFSDTWSNVSYKDTLEELKDIDLDLFAFLESLDKNIISKSAVSYLTTMAIRIYYMHKVLKETGSFYLHCDPTMSHYLKILCDLIFKVTNFRNEIAWCYRGAGYPKMDFGKRHDVILRYSKTANYIFNLDDVREEYAETTKARFKHHIGNIRNGKDFGVQKLHPLGKQPDDWWQIQPIAPSARERLGYPTQKPEALLDKIVKASSNKGSLVADFFGGCGTTISVAQNLKRKWLAVDISHLAIGLIERRLINSYGKTIKNTYEIDGLPKDISSAKQLAEGTSRGRLKFQDWIIEAMIGGVHNPRKTADGGWDGHLTFEMPNHLKEIILIEVKSGNVNVKNLREFIQVINKQKAAIGVFVCFDENVTKPMRLEAKDAGYYKKDIFGANYDRIQIMTVEKLLEGEVIKMPNILTTTFKTAKEKKENGEQPDLFKDK
ncbi:MAG: site-specific DNA-methyltransferase [Deltaproteobacteria bacterium CG07_land_8_20_14_0_80_60_11]|nr:MAG: site-specific DNA-methyltransferase [Deltaproteobacteria bacterium CG07_land_8_20_14_0_80_60_11]